MGFGDNLAKIAIKRKVTFEKIFRGAFLQLSNAVIIGTAKDTGRAQGSWQASVNIPKEDEIDRIDAGAAITEAVNTSKQLKIGDVAMLSNNLPYIEDLEKGSSDQAPNGMVKLAANEFQRVVAKEAARS